MKTVHCPSDQNINWRPPMQGNSHTVKVIEPDAISNWLLVGLHPATWCVQCTLSKYSSEVKT